ncbi:hypothetical protein AVEN_104591-1 [Araneus ventricosus]|uniref:Uncharacterized protein n=1 Tax=Araneus ventricosus TaxID=182803 RepID=A0A4Y2BE25_ARAVE|nr:hypothetical protein AVEN_104591-1 [Araneus ventricosus]
MILTDFLPQFYQGRVCKYATRPRLSNSVYLNDLVIANRNTAGQLRNCHHHPMHQPLPKKACSVIGDDFTTIVVTPDEARTHILIRATSHPRTRCSYP